MPNPQTGSMFYYETVIFYQNASDEWIERFEELLDEGKEFEAHDLIQTFLNKHFSEKVGKKRKEYSQEPPEIGDMVLVTSTRRYARLLAISDDQKLCLVKEVYGAYVVPFDKVIRVR